MQLIQEGFSCDFDISIFIRIFFNKDEVGKIYTYQKIVGNEFISDCKIIYNNFEYFGTFQNSYSGTDEKLIKKYRTLSCVRAFIDAAQKVKNISLPWGALSGIRPAKAVTKLIDNGFSYDFAKDYLIKTYGTSADKADLAIEVAKNERIILSKIKKNSVSIYIGIPFCPTRCKYCSFISADMRVSAKYIDDFISLLLKEIEATKKIINDLDLIIENIYIGGGTPTSLSEYQLEILLTKINEEFDMDNVAEFTLEAGRPDTITKEKLQIAKQNNVSRISINPQTTNDLVLENIGRRHTVADFYKAYDMAKSVGFDVINTDLIAGLPGDSEESFKKSIDDIIKLLPENVTVHSMYRKRAAEFDFEDLADGNVMQNMLNYAQTELKKAGYLPYYMYRQKNISGNLENVGYARDTKFSFYNVNIMEEAQTIIALGGGASTKIVTSDGQIKRIVNYKDPVLYINDFDEMLRRKEETAKIIADDKNASR